MPGKKGGTKRGAEAVADASAKKGRRASEADVALRLGDELGEHTIVSLANIILLKIAADLGCGDTIDHMAVVKNYLCLFVALLFVAKTFAETLITGSSSSPNSKAETEISSDDDEDAARAAAPRPASADFICALHDIANFLLQLVQHIELNVFELVESHECFDFNARNAAGPRFALLKARVQAMGLIDHEEQGPSRPQSVVLQAERAAGRDDLGVACFQQVSAADSYARHACRRTQARRRG